MVSSWITGKARKGISSGIAGRGLFATDPIDAGEVVAVKGGHIVTTQQLHELPDPLPNSEIQIADGLHLAALSPDEYEPVMLFINHSCEPNVGFAANGFFFPRLGLRSTTARTGFNLLRTRFGKTWRPWIGC